MCQGYLRVLAQVCSTPADAGGFMLAALFPQRQGCMLCSGLTAHTHSAIAPACYSLRHSPMTGHKFPGACTRLGMSDSVLDAGAAETCTLQSAVNRLARHSELTGVT